MPLSNIGDGGVQNGGVVLWEYGVYNGSNPSLIGETFIEPAYFIRGADDFLRVRMSFYSCENFFTRANTDMT